MKCHYDRELGGYYIDDQPCRTDDYGDPTHHCTARRTCSEHIAPNEQTCARCLGRTRTDLRRIIALAPLMAIQALGTGVDSEAANLAGPAADYPTFSARRNIDRDWLMTNIPETNLERALRYYLPDDDEHHPYSVLTRWEHMIREAYDDPADDPKSITLAGEYLDRMLFQLAHDPEQDFAQLLREIRTCRNHLEAVIRNSSGIERGAPCNICQPPAPRLVKSYGHWCDDPECDRLHYPADPDTWVCPRDHNHKWEEDDYRRWVADVYEANRVTA